MAIRRVLAEEKIGAITAFARVNNSTFGLTAGHVLTGDDNHLDRNEQVFVYDDSAGEWLFAGVSYAMQFARPDSSVPNNFGTLDSGLFTVINSFGNRISRSLRPVAVHPVIVNGNFRSLIGIRVFSYSVMYKKPISGTIAEIFSHSNVGNPYDLIIDSDDNEIITTQGDSGILWYDVHGFAIGMHTNGNAEGSNTSYSTLINRIINIFQIQQLFVM